MTISYLNKIYNDKIDEVKSRTKKQVDKNFFNSPHYKNMYIEDSEYDVILVPDRDDINKAKLLLKPNTVINIGDYISGNSEAWLVYDFFDNEIYPKCNLFYCNDEIKWDDSGNTINYPCYLFDSDYDIAMKQNNDSRVLVTEGDLNLYTQDNNDTKKIQYDQKFIFGRNIYKVIGINDVLRKGILKISLKFDSYNTSGDEVVNDENNRSDDGADDGDDSLW